MTNSCRRLSRSGVALDPAEHAHARVVADRAPYLFGPGVYDPFGAQLAMYYGFKAV